MDIFSIPSAFKIRTKNKSCDDNRKRIYGKKNREFKFVELMEGGFGF